MKDSVYQGRSYERSESATSNTTTRVGTLAEMVAYLEGLDIGSGGEGEKISSARVTQVAGPQWKCEVVYSDEETGGYTTPPPKAYGKKSATLNCGLISMPLKHRPNYLTNWDHYLACGEKKGETLDLPLWWETATSEILDVTSVQRYRWVKAGSELPGTDKSGRTWRLLAEPTKPGVEGYDLATYQVTESVRQPNVTQAGAYIANRINRIASPNETFSIVGGDWKCDAASIQWNGGCWVATLTYTRSGDESGWDPDLYDEGG